mgnify:CR=1
MEDVFIYVQIALCLFPYAVVKGKFLPGRNVETFRPFIVFLKLVLTHFPIRFSVSSSTYEVLNALSLPSAGNTRGYCPRQCINLVT